MNLAIGLTAARYGAVVANYTEVVRLLKTTDPLTGRQKVCGARCRDAISGEHRCPLLAAGCFLLLTGGNAAFIFSGAEFDVKAKCVINATGPFTDSLRKMDNQQSQNICQPSAGVHIVIPGYYRYLLPPPAAASSAHGLLCSSS